MSETGKIITNAPNISMQKVHPTMTAGRTFRAAEYDPEVETDSDRVRCKQCGFMCDRNRDSKGNGYGNESLGAAISGIDETKYSPTVSNGCPLCGSSEYE